MSLPDAPVTRTSRLSGSPAITTPAIAGGGSERKADRHTKPMQAACNHGRNKAGSLQRQPWDPKSMATFSVVLTKPKPEIFSQLGSIAPFHRVRLNFDI